MNTLSCLPQLVMSKCHSPIYWQIKYCTVSKRGESFSDWLVCYFPRWRHEGTGRSSWVGRGGRKEDERRRQEAVEAPSSGSETLRSLRTQEWGRLLGHRARPPRSPSCGSGSPRDGYKERERPGASVHGPLSACGRTYRSDHLLVTPGTGRMLSVNEHRGWVWKEEHAADGHLVWMHVSYSSCMSTCLCMHFVVVSIKDRDKKTNTWRVTY